MVQSIEEARSARPGARVPAQNAVGRIPPNNIEAESALLGAMMISFDAIGTALEMGITPEHFYKPLHQHVMTSVMALSAVGEPVEPISVSEDLRRRGLLEAVGGMASLLRIQATSVASTNAGHYAQIVSDLALSRRLIRAATEIADLGYDETDDVSRTIDSAEQMIFEVAEHRNTQSMQGIKEGLSNALEHIEHLIEHASDVTGAPTGFRELDRLLLGLQPSTLNIVAARPGCGKTAFGLGVLSQLAMKTGKPSIFFSMEMGQLELVKRVLAAEARVDARKLSTGKLAEADWMKVNTAVGRLAEAPILIDDNPNCTVMEMRSKARRIKALHGDIGVIVVDYLQLMTGGGRRADNRQNEVAEISRGLKILARDLDCPVVALSQLNRQLEQRTDKRPMLADLRESGSLEQDADIVMFIYRDEIYHEDSDQRGLAEIIIAKHRNGPTGTVKLAFLEQYTKFADMARD